MVEQIVVVGSGVMGRGIAYVAAHRGFQVTLVDIKEEYVESAYRELERIAEKGITRGKMSRMRSRDCSIGCICRPT